MKLPFFNKPQPPLHTVEKSKLSFDTFPPKEDIAITDITNYFELNVLLQHLKVHWYKWHPGCYPSWDDDTILTSRDLDIENKLIENEDCIERWKKDWWLVVTVYPVTKELLYGNWKFIFQWARDRNRMPFSDLFNIDNS